MEQLKNYQVGYDDFKTHFEFVSESASVAFGEFKVMRNITTGQEVLVKPQETQSLQETEELLNTISEINIQLNGCPHFLQFLGFTEVPHEERIAASLLQHPASQPQEINTNLIYLVFEHFPDTIEAAWPLLIQQSQKHTIEDLLKRLASSMSMCFATLELIGQAHTDVSMQNIVCFENKDDHEIYFKLIYSQYTTSAFRQVIDLQQHESSYFLAPEIQEKIASKVRSSTGLDPQKIDVYAFGKLLLLLSTQKDHSVDMSAKHSLQDEECVRGLLQIVQLNYSEDFYNLLCQMMDAEYTKRPSFQMIGFTLSTIEIAHKHDNDENNDGQEDKVKKASNNNNQNGKPQQRSATQTPQLQTQNKASAANTSELERHIEQLNKIPLPNRALEIRNDLFSTKKQSRGSNNNILPNNQRDRSISNNQPLTNYNNSRFSNGGGNTSNQHQSSYYTPGRHNNAKKANLQASPAGSLTRSHFSPVSHSPYQRRANNVPNQQFGYNSSVHSQYQHHQSKGFGGKSEIFSSQSRYSPSRYSSNGSTNINNNNNPYMSKEYFDRMLQEIERKTILDEAGQLRAGMIRKDYQDGSVYLGEVATNEAGTEVREGSGVYYYKNFEGNIMYSELVPNVPFGEMFAGEWKSNHFHGNGVYLFASGERYEGYLRDGQKNGEGTYYYANGNEYKGEWENDLKSGNGLFLYNTIGERYQGFFANGQRSGQGTYHYKNGDMYHLFTHNKQLVSSFSGNWEHGEKQGSGEVIFADGSHFEGEWRDDQPNGTGKMVYQNGDLYEGNFTNGCKDGEGVYLHSKSNSKFQGFFRADEPNGSGIFTYSNSDSYEGDIKSGQRHGRGVYTYENGDRYEGEWKFDKKHGQGVFAFSDNSLYTGAWAAGQIKGQGSMDYANGDTYRGEWLKDKKHGKGFYKWESGNTYKGDWRNDKMNGKGVFVSVNGKTFSGMWNDNKLVTKI